MQGQGHGHGHDQAAASVLRARVQQLEADSQRAAASSLEQQKALMLYEDAVRRATGALGVQKEHLETTEQAVWRLRRLLAFALQWWGQANRELDARGLHGVEVASLEGLSQWAEGIDGDIGIKFVRADDQEEHAKPRGSAGKGLIAGVMGWKGWFGFMYGYGGPPCELQTGVGAASVTAKYQPELEFQPISAPVSRSPSPGGATANVHLEFSSAP